MLCSYDLHFGLSIWPKFKADGWNLYHLSFEVTKGASIEHFLSYLQQQGLPSNFSVTVYDETLAKSETFNLVSVPVKINFAPAVLELACGGVVIGTRPINLAAAPAPSGGIDVQVVGLDFGTTNSCMAYELMATGQRESINLANTMNEPASIEMVLSRLKCDTAASEFLSNAGGFYLQRQASIAPQYALTMPSELLLSLSLSSDRGEMDAKQISILQNQRAPQRPPQLNGVDVIAPIFTPLPSEFHGYDQNTTSSLTLIRLLLEKVVCSAFMAILSGRDKVTVKGLTYQQLCVLPI
ncbi:MAG: hypothetical protein IPG70_08585 [Moraxellaceae bacterium]|nr:hypothetical protein [Moraxellaceae bacterium]